LETLIKIFSIFSLIGLALSFIVQATVLFGFNINFGTLEIILHISIFIVIFPAIFCAIKIQNAKCKKKFFLKYNDLFGGCPTYMQRIHKLILVYVFISGFIAQGTEFIDWISDDQRKVFSFACVWIFFYSFSFCLQYSYLRLIKSK